MIVLNTIFPSKYTLLQKQKPAFLCRITKCKISQPLTFSVCPLDSNNWVAVSHCLRGQEDGNLQVHTEHYTKKLTASYFYLWTVKIYFKLLRKYLATPDTCTLRWRFVGCIYCPRVKQSTSAARSAEREEQQGFQQQLFQAQLQTKHRSCEDSSHPVCSVTTGNARWGETQSFRNT